MASLDALRDGVARGQTGTYRAIGVLYNVLARCRRDTAFLEALLTTHKVRRWGKREASHLVVQAVKNAVGKGKEWPRSTVSEWAKMLRACEVAKVEVDPQAVVRWFEKKEDVRGDGAPLQGYQKAHAVLAVDPEECAARHRLRQDRQRARTEASDSEIGRGSETPIGSVVADDEIEMPDGIWIAIMDGKSVRRVLTADMKLVRKVAVLCRESSAESAAAEA